jgi:allophanate hydrolase subunit 2
MGLRFEGPAIEHGRGADIISDGMPRGAVQVPGDGKPIIMLADRQTTGGYPKIACVAQVDLDLLAHLRPGDRVRFAALPAEEAHKSLIHEQAASRASGRALRILIDGIEHVVTVCELQ